MNRTKKILLNQVEKSIEEANEFEDCIKIVYEYGLSLGLKSERVNDLVWRTIDTYRQSELNVNWDMVIYVLTFSGRHL